MDGPLESIFVETITKCYYLYGWKNSSTSEDRTAQPFGLFEFILEFKKLVKSSGYDSHVKGNIETGGTFRLMNLINQNSFIYDNVRTIPIETLLNKPTILELNAISDGEQKALLMALLLISICLYTKSKGASNGQLRNVLLVDEAHVLLSPANISGQESSNKAQSATVKSLQDMIAEIRSFGTGIIIADQSPSKVSREIVANTDVKIAFRLVEKTERDMIANSTNMTDSYRDQLATLKTGCAMVYYQELESPKVVSTPDIRKEVGIRLDVTDLEVKTHTDDYHIEAMDQLPFYECRKCVQCLKGCDLVVRGLSDYYTSYILSVFDKKIKSIDDFKKYLYRLHDLVILYEKRNPSGCSLKCICNCSKIHFMRKTLLQKSIEMSRTERCKLLDEILFGEVTNHE